jgi:hypothetical protein
MAIQEEYRQMTLFDFYPNAFGRNTKKVKQALQNANKPKDEIEETPIVNMPKKRLKKVNIVIRKEGEPLPIEELQRLFKICLKEVKAAGIKPGKIVGDVLVNKRYSRRWGTTTTRRQGKPDCNHVISVSPHLLLTDEKSIKNTLVHEILHTCDGCQNHGELWQHYAAIMNRKYGYKIQTKTSNEEKGMVIPPNAKYCFRCKKCNKLVFHYKHCNMVDNPDFYVHRNCGGTFELITPTKAREIALEHAKKNVKKVAEICD